MSKVPENLRGTELRVGITVAAMPLGDYTEDRKGIRGLDFDLLEGLSKKLGVTFKYDVATFDSLIPAVTNGRYDIGISGFYATPARKEIVDVVSYMTDGTLMIVKKDRTDIKSPEDFCGKNIALIKGTVQVTTIVEQAKACEATGKPLQTHVYPTNVFAAAALVDGRDDVFLNGASLGYYLIHQKSGELAAAADPYGKVNVGMVLKKGSAMSPAIKAGIDEMIQDGSYQRIMTTFGLEKATVTSSEVNP